MESAVKFFGQQGPIRMANCEIKEPISSGNKSLPYVRNRVSDKVYNAWFTILYVVKHVDSLLGRDTTFWVAAICILRASPQKGLRQQNLGYYWIERWTDQVSTHRRSTLHTHLGTSRKWKTAPAMTLKLDGIVERKESGDGHKQRHFKNTLQ